MPESVRVFHQCLSVFVLAFGQPGKRPDDAHQWALHTPGDVHGLSVIMGEADSGAIVRVINTLHTPDDAAWHFLRSKEQAARLVWIIQEHVRHLARAKE